MNLHEYQGKQLFAEYGLPVSKGYAVDSADEAAAAADKIGGDMWVVKAQVHAGGRGKAGGVKLVKSKDEIRDFAEQWLGKNLVTYQTDEAGQPVSKILVETCTDIARLALDDALVWIDETYGQSLESLRWGDAHQATHDHPVLGDVGWFSWIVNIRQSTSGGDNTLQRGKTAGSGDQPFLNTHAATYRGVYDFADPDSSVFITSTGQSGHPLSRHYDDLGELWRRGEYIPMTLDPDLARAGAVGVTTLNPISQ